MTTRATQVTTLALGLLLGCHRPPPPTETPGPTPAPASAAAPEPEVPLTPARICALAPQVVVPPLAGARPFAPSFSPDPATAAALGPLRPGDGTKCERFCDSVDPSEAADVCAIANQNIRRNERMADKDRGPVTATRATRATRPWDPARPPKYLDRIDAHLHLTAEEHDRLRASGFVVLDRLAYASYASAFHDVFQEQLPLYVGVDAVLYAVFRGTEHALERIERSRLAPALTSMLRKLRSGLAAARGAYDGDTLVDLDAILGVAWALAGRATDGEPVTVLGSEVAEGLARSLLTAAKGRQLAPVDLFGRKRMVDFSQLEPRGHYAASVPFESTLPGEPSLGQYFAAVMWLSRLDLNLVTRSCRSSDVGGNEDLGKPTPREARDALALAEVAERSGALAELATFDGTYRQFAGVREDVSPPDLLRIARAAHVTAHDRDAGARLAAAIGSRFPRTARTHFTPEGCGDLPAIATLLGPRIVPDVEPLTALVHDRVRERKSVPGFAGGDLGFVLGHDRSKRYVRDLGQFPDLPGALDGARARLARGAHESRDLYGSWLRAILALGQAPPATAPSFTTHEAYADARLNSALVGFGELRHAFVLLAAQGYDSYGCEIPDAYVEPLPAVYDALLEHVRALRTAAHGWEGLERVVSTLAALAHDEAEGRELTAAQRRWLGMVSEYVPSDGYVSTGEPPKWTGWYVDMFEDRQHGASRSAAFVADYFTLTNAERVAYVGSRGPRLGVFVVDAGGEPRAMVGPVAEGYELQMPIEKRLTDKTALAAELPRQAPWRESFAVPERPAPALGLEVQVVHCEDQDAGPSPPMPSYMRAKVTPGGTWRVAVRSAVPAGPVTVTLLDHHGDAITPDAHFEAGSTWTIVELDVPPEVAKAAYGVEALHLRVDDLARAGVGTGPWDYVTSPSVFAGAFNNDDDLVDLLHERPHEVEGAFTIGPR
jgi:Protein of unknown function (DUF3160)